jgi:hypothetical protein
MTILIYHIHQSKGFAFFISLLINLFPSLLNLGRLLIFEGINLIIFQKIFQG